MHHYNALDAADYKRMQARKRKRNAGKLQALAKEREKCARELQKIEEQKRVDAENAIMSQLMAGHLRVRDLVYGVDINDLADDFAKHGNIKQSARKYGVAALVTIANSLQSDDERNRLVAAKIIVDAATPTKDEGKQESKDVGFPAIVIEGA